MKIDYSTCDFLNDFTPNFAVFLSDEVYRVMTEDVNECVSVGERNAKRDSMGGKIPQRAATLVA